MSKLMIVIYLLAFYFQRNLAQEAINKETMLNADILIEDTGEELITITPICRNQGEKERLLTYRLTVRRTDDNGNQNSSSQGGAFSIKPEEEKPLSQQQINVPLGSMLTVELNLLEEGTVIISDTLVRIFPKKIDRGGEDRGSIQQDPDLFDIGGFVLDETRTRAGRDLYDMFYSQWLSLGVTGDYTIRFEELPFRFQNTIIKVYLNDSLILERILQPNFDYLESLAGALANYLQGRVQELNQIQDDLDNELIEGPVEIY